MPTRCCVILHTLSHWIGLYEVVLPSATSLGISLGLDERCCVIIHALSSDLTRYGGRTIICIFGDVVGSPTGYCKDGWCRRILQAAFQYMHSMLLVLGVLSVLAVDLTGPLIFLSCGIDILKPRMLSYLRLTISLAQSD